MNGSGVAGVEERHRAPKDYWSLRALIAQRAERLPKRLKQIAAYALENPAEIAFGTVANVAGNAQVPPSAVIRFSRAFHYHGFSELQEVFRSWLKERVLNSEDRMARLREHGGATSKSSLVLDGFLTAAEGSLADLRAAADHEAIERAVDILAGAETIYLIGVERSFPITSHVRNAMGKLRIHNILVDASVGLGAEEVNLITPRDAVLSISFTPYGGETVTQTSSARVRGARIVSITDSVLSPIARSADVLLQISEANFEGFRSMVAPMTLAMTLTVAVAGKRGGELGLRS